MWEIDGYSKHVLGVLQRGQLYAMVAGQGKQIMVSEEAKREALQEFQVWLELCECTAKAEFPDFEVLNSMCVFNLAEDLSRRGEAPNDSSHCLRRVAQALKLEPFLLKAEWEKLRPIAAAQKKMEVWTVEKRGRLPMSIPRKLQTFAKSMAWNVCRQRCKHICAGAPLRNPNLDW